MITNLIFNKYVLKGAVSIAILFALFFVGKWAWEKVAFANPKVKQEMADYEILKADYTFVQIANDSLNRQTVECELSKTDLILKFQTVIDSLNKRNKVLLSEDKKNKDMIDHFIEVGACTEVITVNNGFLKKKTQKRVLVDCPK